MRIIENFIPRFYQQSILDIMTSVDFNWVYVNNISGVDGKLATKDELKFASNQSGFAHTFVSVEIQPDYQSMLFYPMKYAIEETIMKNVEISRIRAGMFLNDSEGGIHYPHVDYYSPHQTLLYYVNDSDGDTILFNEFCEKQGEQKVLTTSKRISPKMGRAVIFDGLRYHSSSVPIKSQNRIALNINFNIKQ